MDYWDKLTERTLRKVNRDMMIENKIEGIKKYYHRWKGRVGVIIGACIFGIAIIMGIALISHMIAWIVKR